MADIQVPPLPAVGRLAATSTTGRDFPKASERRINRYLQGLNSASGLNIALR